MKRFAIKDYGEAVDVFEEITDQPRVVEAGRIRVAIKAFAVNPYDVSLRQGKMKDFRSLKFPYVLGNDGAGIVTEVGQEVADFAVGNRVVVHPISGAYGEEVVLPAWKAAKLPAKMSFSEAAGLVTTGITAYNLLFQLLKVRVEQTIMVQGASGGVGSLLIQLLRQNGNRVLATASKQNEQLVRDLGATEFAAYDEVDPGAVFADQADVVIDATKGSRSGQSGMRIMKAGGTYVALNQLPAEGERTKEGTYLSFVPKKEYSDSAAFAHLLKVYETEGLLIHIADEQPFERSSVVAAHQRLEGHPPAGKLIIKK